MFLNFGLRFKDIKMLNDLNISLDYKFVVVFLAKTASIFQKIDF